MSDTQQSDKSKFIRTYAKDVAALAGGGESKARPAPRPPVPKPIPPPPPAAPKPAKEIEPIYEARVPEKSQKDLEREATLERLRKKVSESAKMTIEAPSAPPPPPPRPAFEPPSPAPTPPLPPLSRVEEKPAPLRTYTSDFADRIDEKGASAFSVLAAEQDNKPAPKPKVPARNLVPIIAATALIALGGAGLGGAVWYVMKSGALPFVSPAVPSLVTADEEVRLTGSGSDLMGELAALANEPIPAGDILVTYLSEATTTDKGNVVEVPLTGGQLIATMQLPAPAILLRNIAPESTVGIVSAGNETRPFFVFRVSSYERTFAGMLAWETSMARDLIALYPARDAGALTPTATTTPIGTSTPTTALPAQPRAQFEDAVVASHDVRVLKDTNGQTLILYGYARKDILILARDEAAYAALIARLVSQ